MFLTFLLQQVETGRTIAANESFFGDHIAGNFVIGILSGLVTSAVFAFLLGVLSKQTKGIFTAIFGLITSSDIVFVYPNKDEAESDITSELDKTTKVYVLTGRGNELQRKPFTSILNNKPTHKKVDIRILLPETKCDSTGVDWTLKRSEEIAMFDVGFKNPEILKNQIEANAKYLSERDGVQVRRYVYPHIGRALLTDNFIYYTPYDKNYHGENTPIIKYKLGAMHRNYHRLFDLLWNSAEKNETS